LMIRDVPARDRPTGANIMAETETPHHAHYRYRPLARRASSMRHIK
jgi:hypothetical protein